SGTVATDHAVDRTGRHLEAHAPQRLDQHRPPRTIAHARERSLQRLLLLPRHAEADPEIVDPDGRWAIRGGLQNHALGRGTQWLRRGRNQLPRRWTRAGSP